MSERRAKDDSVLDELVAADMVNHAAGLRGRGDLRQILRAIDVDLGPVTVEHWACRDHLGVLEQIAAAGSADDAGGR
ncbi:MAG TPA: hypothetical protein VIH06_15925 [Ilumatobacteraceae bacterium]